jgi:hypothetical protein
MEIEVKPSAPSAAGLGAANRPGSRSGNDFVFDGGALKGEKGASHET